VLGLQLVQAMTILTPTTLTIIHQWTGERRTLQVTGMYAKEIAVRWPLWGVLRFHNRNGKGIGRAAQWMIEPASLAELHKSLGLHFGPAEEDESGQKDIKESR
jgi:hypothetical protein